MRMLSALTVVLLLLSGPARAQSVNAADLVGTWAGRFIQHTPDSQTMKIKDIIIFRPDSTYSWTSKKGIKGQFTHWATLTNDSLWLGPKGEDGYKFILKGQQLTLSKSNLAWIFKRIDVPTTKP